MKITFGQLKKVIKEASRAPSAKEIIAQLSGFGRTEIYDDEVLNLFDVLLPNAQRIDVGTTKEKGSLELRAYAYVGGKEFEVTVPASSDLGTLASLLLKKLNSPVTEATGNWIAPRNDSPRTYGDWYAELEDLCLTERGCSVDDLPVFSMSNSMRGSKTIRNAFRLGKSGRDTLDALVNGDAVV